MALFIWLSQEDAVASATKAMSYNILVDARSSSNEAIRLGVSKSDRRLVSVLEYIAKEDAKEEAVAAAQSAVISLTFTLAKEKYASAISFGVPPLDSRLIEVNKWLENETAKEASIVAAVDAKSASDSVKAKKCVGEALHKGASPKESRRFLRQLEP